jgi:hypothetical protein
MAVSFDDSEGKDGVLELVVALVEQDADRGQFFELIRVLGRQYFGIDDGATPWCFQQLDVMAKARMDFSSLLRFDVRRDSGALGKGTCSVVSASQAADVILDGSFRAVWGHLLLKDHP